MIFKKTIILNCPIQTVWHYLMKPELLIFIAKPIQHFIPVEPNEFPETWQHGTYKTKLLTLGFIPFGQHSIVIEIPPDNSDKTKKLRDNGYGEIITQWNHLIELNATTDDKTRYTDTVDIKAGFLTPFIWLYAAMFYTWRQHQWQYLVSNNFSDLKLRS